jgi:hypothetical protein
MRAAGHRKGVQRYDPGGPTAPDREADTVKVHLKTTSQKYITAEGGGGFLLLANRDEAGDWEIFELDGFDENKDADGQEVGLKVYGNQLVRLRDDAAGTPMLVADAPAGGEDKFVIVAVEYDLEKSKKFKGKGGGGVPNDAPSRIALKQEITLPDGVTKADRFVSAENGSGGRLTLTGESIQAHELFWVEPTV